MFHINGDDEAKICRAASPQNCRFYRGEENSRHYEKQSDAIAASEKLLADKNVTHATTVRYSFTKQFREQEKQFDEKFDGVPSRFFNADLRGKAMPQDDNLEPEKIMSRTRYQELGKRLMLACSAPADAQRGEAEIMETAAALGIEEFHPIDDVKLLQNLKADDGAWSGQLNGKQIVVSRSAVPANRNVENVYLRIGTPTQPARQNFVFTDVRTLVGAQRAQRLTGDNLLNLTSAPRVPYSGANPEEIAKNIISLKTRAIAATVKLEEEQLAGANFKAQQKHIREHSGKHIAGVFDQKKDTDELHKNLMKNTRLNEDFRAVELDNDVDAEELTDFENAFHEVKHKLPPIEQGKEPHLYIKKLGKHRATGLFASSINSLAIDVRTSGSFVHEYGHYIDMIAKDNASLQGNFRSIVKEYSDNLEVPSGEPSSRRSYLTTPTEIYARFFEVYCSERLGVNNRLLDSSKLDNYDYKPIQNNPHLKEKAFKLFDEMFSK